MAAGDIWTLRGGMLVPVTRHGFAEIATGAFDVIVPIGQSNARGAATDYDLSDAYPDGVFMWHWGLGSIVAASEPLSNNDGFAGMGIGNTFVQDYVAERLAPGRKVLVVNTAYGGTGFSTPSTNSGGSSYTWDRTAADNAYNLALRTRDRLQSIMASLPASSEIVAFLANHGSTDGTNNMAKATFKSKLQDWITWIRDELDVPTTPYLMMQMRPSLLSEPRHNNIDQPQQEVAADPTYVNVGYAFSPNGAEYNKADSVHFNALGVRTIGHSLFDVYDAM